MNATISAFFVCCLFHIGNCVFCLENVVDIGKTDTEQLGFIVAQFKNNYYDFNQFIIGALVGYLKISTQR